MSCAERAGHLALGHELVAYCPSCGDDVPGVPYVAGNLDRAPSQLYLRTSPDQFTNLATLVGCDAGSAATSLHVEHDHGELIVPDAAAPPSPADHTPWELGIVPLVLLGLLGLAVRRRRPLVPRALHL